MNPEQARLEEARTAGVPWSFWGPYLSERQWGTVREDYSPGGTAWEYFPHDHARSRAYRWGEDGLGGLCDEQQRLCFALCLWNGRDPILKERAFGLTGNQGNHGEDVKECYYYLDNTPTHSYMKYLYRYPQAAFPYARLEEENRRRGKGDPEYELADTGVFEANRYFDVFVEYAKADAGDILVQITAFNRGPEKAGLHLLPTLWFRNDWDWWKDAPKPSLLLQPPAGAASRVLCRHAGMAPQWFYGSPGGQALFTENQTNFPKLFSTGDPRGYFKDGINDAVVLGRKKAVRPDGQGTKMALHYSASLEAGASLCLKFRLAGAEKEDPFGPGFDQTLALRRREADQFYQELASPGIPPDLLGVQRQAFAGMLWSKQYYYWNIEEWLQGDETMPPPPPGRLRGRNAHWLHFRSSHVLSMPDKWEYPWFASWDLGFHLIPFSLLDPEFAKQQLILLLREWFMHPSGQIPAYEWAFDDVNPPVQAWAALRIYRIEEKTTGRRDRLFLERVFQKLLLNFTWWVNRKDSRNDNIFEGGFLGLDNVGVFDRGMRFPSGEELEQSDATSWMGQFCVNMLAIALELAQENPAYEDMATKFFEHFLYIARAINQEGSGLWDDADGFYYDVLKYPDGANLPLRVQSLVGLIPLLAVETLEPSTLAKLPEFKRHMDWFIRHRPDLGKNIASLETPGVGGRRLLSLVSADRLKVILQKMLDEGAFLSPHGIRSLSKFHQEHPYDLRLDGKPYHIGYEPAESASAVLGGNSNWRGPVWFPVNYLLIEALQRFHFYLGDGALFECPAGSGKKLNLWQIASLLTGRLISLYQADGRGKAPVCGVGEAFPGDPPGWLFFEYFDGDTGAGLGASHQTGWTGLIAKLIQQHAEYALSGKPPDLGSRER